MHRPPPGADPRARSRSLNSEGEDGPRTVLLPRPQDGGGKARLVRGVREMLRFEHQTRAVAVHVTGFSGDGAVEKIPGIELQPGLGGRYLERPTGLRLDHSDSRGEA